MSLMQEFGLDLAQPQLKQDQMTYMWTLIYNIRMYFYDLFNHDITAYKMNHYCY